MNDTPPLAAVPAVDPDSAWWWNALGGGDGLMLPRCTACRLFSFPPMAACPHCGGVELEHVPVRGRGRVYSWVVIHMPQSPAFDDEAPYTILTVELDEGPRAFGRLVGEGEPQDGAPVRAVPLERAGVTLLGFELEAP